MTRCNDNDKESNYIFYSKIDDFIKNNKESNNIFSSISSNDLKISKEKYNKIKNLHDIHYSIFSRNSWDGWDSIFFSLYRSKEQINYLIRVSNNTITDYTIINLKNEYYFD